MITVKDIQYEAGKMPPREQFHVMRRLSPLMATVGRSFIALLQDDPEEMEKLSPDEKQQRKAAVMRNIMDSLGPLTEVLSSLPDEHLDYVLDHCLLYVKRLDMDNKLHPIYVTQGRNSIRMYQDIDLLGELRLVGEVIKVNLEGFFGVLSAGSALPLSSLQGKR